MQENWLQIASTFTVRKSYVLATIVATKGATYRKVGTLMLIDEDGECTGLLSGGCLEADISLHAKDVLTRQKTKLLTYDLSSDDNLLWGLGLGCDGAIELLLQPLLPENNHLEFAMLLDALSNRKTGYYLQNISNKNAAQGQFIESELTGESTDRVISNEEIHGSLSSNNEQLIIPVLPPISVLICGAGPDVVPVVNIVNQLGWQATLWDHRPAYLQQNEFDLCYRKRKVRAEYTKPTEYRAFDAVVVMTHNLEFDAMYLSKALSANVNYIGLLGPAGRRDKLLKENSLTFEEVQGQVYGPVGLDLGGRSPQAIALSITAQIQQHLSKQYTKAQYRAWRQVAATSY
jgi:xanthine dehydrogenase accessory factor